jgi:hypothetical protein
MKEQRIKSWFFLFLIMGIMFMLVTGCKKSGPPKRMVRASIS